MRGSGINTDDSEILNKRKMLKQHRNNTILMQYASYCLAVCCIALQFDYMRWLNLNSVTFYNIYAHLHI